MAQLMPNGFEEYEIRYSPIRAELCERLASKFFGVRAMEVLGAEGMRLGLLALCLFLVSKERYAADDTASFGVLLHKLGLLQPTTVAVMYAEHEEQRLLFSWASQDVKD